MRTLCCCILSFLLLFLFDLRADSSHSQRTPLGVAAVSPFKALHVRSRLSLVPPQKELARGRRNRERSHSFSHDATGLTRPYRYLLLAKICVLYQKVRITRKGVKMGVATSDFSGMFH